MNAIAQARSIAGRIREGFQRTVATIQPAIQQWQAKPSNQIWNDTMAGISNAVKKVGNYDINPSAPGSQSLSNLSSQIASGGWRQITPFSATSFQGQSIPMPVRQFRDSALQASTMGLVKNKLPSPQNGWDTVGNVAGNLAGSLPYFAGANNVISGGVKNFNRLPLLPKIGIGMLEGAMGVGLTTPGNFKTRLQAAGDTLKPTPTNIALNSLPFIAMAGIQRTPAVKEAARLKSLTFLHESVSPEDAISRIQKLEQAAEKSEFIPTLKKALKDFRKTLVTGPGLPQHPDNRPIIVEIDRIIAGVKWQKPTVKDLLKNGQVRVGISSQTDDLEKLAQTTRESSIARSVESELNKMRLAGDLPPIEITNYPKPSTPKTTGSVELDRTALKGIQLSKTNEEIIQAFGGIPENIQRKPLKGLQNNEEIIKAVTKKVSLVDYLRTPDRVLEKLGLQKESNALRQGFATYQKQLPKELSVVTDWASRVSDNPNSNRKIFNYLDGKKIPLTDKELQVATEIKGYLKDWAIRLDLPQDKQVSDYITHIFERGQIEQEFDPELAKLIDETIPKSVYDPFLQRRVEKPGYIQDTWRALDAYIKRGVRKQFMDPALEKVSNAAISLDVDSQKYIKSYIDKINLRPQFVDNLMDTFVKQSPVGYKLGQRPTATVTRNVRQYIYRGTLGLNFKSALRNLTQGTNTYAKLGERWTVKGYMDAVKSMVTNSDELTRVGVLSDELIQDRQISAVKGTMQKLDEGLFYFFDKAEKINRGGAYFGAKARALSQGKTLDQAIQEGIQTARDTQFTFSNVDTPLVLQGDLAKTLLQFQSYNLKQGEFLTEMALKKEWGGLARWVGANIVLITALKDLLGFEYTDMIPSYRIGGSPAFTLGKDVVATATGQPDKYGNKPSPIDRAKTLASDLVPFIPGGVQAKKTIQGLQAYTQGYSASKSGRVQYPIEQNVLNLVKSVILGKNSTPEANAYFDSNGSPVSVETALSRDLSKALLSGDTAKIEKVMKKIPLESTDPGSLAKEAVKQALADAITNKNKDALTRLIPMAKTMGLEPSEVETVIRNKKYSTKDKKALKLKLVTALEKQDKTKLIELITQAKEMNLDPKDIDALLKLRQRQRVK